MALSSAQRRLLSCASSGIQFSAYKSSISLDKLYPSSTLNIAKKPTVPQNGDEVFSGYIPMESLKISHCRSSGPGGQHVNTVNTKVEVRFHVDSADWIPESIRNIMKSKARSWITKDGYMFVASDRTRYQHMNTADALEKIRELIRSCEPVKAAEPTPETADLLRKRAEKAARERLRQKRDRASIKSSRGASDGF